MLASCRCCARDRPLGTRYDLGGTGKIFKRSVAKHSGMGCVILRDRVFRISHASLLSWCSVLGRQMGLSLRGIAQSGVKMGLSLRGIAQ